MSFVNLVQTSAGRLARALVGIALILVGLFVVHGGWGIVLALVGLVPLAAGILRVCLVAPLFGVSPRQHA